MSGKIRGELRARKQAICRQAQRRHTSFYERCAHWSFERSESVPPLHWHRERWVLASTALMATLLSGFIMPTWATAMKPAPTVEAHTLLPLALPKPKPVPRAVAAAQEDWLTVHVQPGQTLSDIFGSHDLSLADLQKVMDASGDAKSALHHLSPGQEFDLLPGPDGSLRGIRFDKDQTTRAIVRLDGPQPALTLQPRTMNVREKVAHGVIQSSLFAAAANAGMNEAMVVKLADIFKYDIDFIKDIRSGDSFTVIYNDIYRDGTYLHDGDIVAAEFVNQGKRYTAYRFRKADGSIGWFSEDGRPLRKSLMRTPVAFTRISSVFSLARKHPILGYARAHKGVDYAAPTGTPIHAAGDGTIVYRGWENGYGNFVLVKHNGTYSTAYGHMSRFAKGEHVGSHVSQGEVIGYVGMTGLATGPHLHYEVRIDGRQVNPLTVTMPKPQPLPPTELAKFESTVVKPQLARLQMLDTRYKMARADTAATTPKEN